MWICNYCGKKIEGDRYIIAFGMYENAKKINWLVPLFLHKECWDKLIGESASLRELFEGIPIVRGKEVESEKEESSEG